MTVISRSVCLFYPKILNNAAKFVMQQQFYADKCIWKNKERNAFLKLTALRMPILKSLSVTEALISCRIRIGKGVVV